MQLVLQPGVAPVDAPLPDSLQELLNDVAAYTTLQGLETLTGVIISVTEPGSSDRDKVWVKKDPASDRVIGLFTYKGGWTAIPVVVGTGEVEPANPETGEWFYNTKVGALKFYTGSQWTTNFFPTGTTANRPTNVPINYLYFDTDIQRLLRYASQGWTTFDGCISEVRMFGGITSEDALTRNPGWVVYAAMGGRFPRGPDDEFGADQDGGADSVAWSADSATAAGPNTNPQPVLKNLSIDGDKFTAPGSATTHDGSFRILPPFHTLVFLQKSY